MKKSPDLAKIEADYQALLDSQRTLLLASVDENGEADNSYAPFLQWRNCYYVYVSNLAAHTGNLLRTRQASVMFIQPEAEAANPFARQRLIFDCRAEEIAREDDQYPQVLDAMQSRFGEVVGVLRGLPDFRLIALAPRQGRYVAGFGKTYSINIDGGTVNVQD